MATKKDQFPRVDFMSPKGKARYPHLNKPDTEYKEQGEYKTGLIVDPDEAMELVQKAKEMAEEYLSKEKDVHFPFATIDGELVMTCKSNYAPKFYDAAANLVPPGKVPELWGGSILKLKGAMQCYKNGSNAGVKLYLSSVQIIEPKSGAESGGTFSAEEGFEIEASAFEPEDPTADALYNAE